MYYLSPYFSKVGAHTDLVVPWSTMILWRRWLICMSRKKYGYLNFKTSFKCCHLQPLWVFATPIFDCRLPRLWLLKMFWVLLCYLPASLLTNNCLVLFWSFKGWNSSLSIFIVFYSFYCTYVTFSSYTCTLKIDFHWWVPEDAGLVTRT